MGVGQKNVSLGLGDQAKNPESVLNEYDKKIKLLILSCILKFSFILLIYKKCLKYEACELLLTSKVGHSGSSLQTIGLTCSLRTQSSLAEPDQRFLTLIFGDFKIWHSEINADRFNKFQY